MLSSCTFDSQLALLLRVYVVVLVGVFTVLYVLLPYGVIKNNSNVLY